MTKPRVRRDRAASDAWQAMADLVLNNERRREVSEEVGLSFGKVRALRRIARRPMPMSELASLLTVDPPNLTPVVDDLERAGLVERQPHPTDRRVKLVVATPAGTALAQMADEILSLAAGPPLHALPRQRNWRAWCGYWVCCSLIPHPTTEHPQHPASGRRGRQGRRTCAPATLWIRRTRATTARGAPPPRPPWDRVGRSMRWRRRR